MVLRTMPIIFSGLARSSYTSETNVTLLWMVWNNPGVAECVAGGFGIQGIFELKLRHAAGGATAEITINPKSPR